MNHLFLMQVHKDPPLVKRILYRLAAPNHFFAINVDKKSSERQDLLNVINSVPNVILTTEYSITHGGYSMIECTISQMRSCCAYETEFEYFHTLSGQDYPCVSNERFDRFFEECNGTSYTVMDSPEQAQVWREVKYRNRLERYNFTDQIKGALSQKLHLNGVVRKLVSPIRRPYNGLNIIWGGWNWFSLTNECIEYLLKYFDQHPDYVKRFRYTTCSDELIYSTVLYYQRDRLHIETRNSLRYVEWHPQREHQGLPLICDEREYDDIVNSGALFCRKVERESSKALLEKLDSRAELMQVDEPLLQNPKLP